jgi:hypothetical protein
MDSTFQQIVLAIAIILLILILVFIGYSLSNSKAEKTWPPKIANCPDYWEDDSIDANKVICSNVKNLGASCGASKEFLPSATLCDKYKWANTCGAQWDGITYGYGEYKPCEAKKP